MATDIILRSVKASALTHAEMDQNWESLAQTVDAHTSSATIAVTDQNKILEVSIASGTMTLPTVANAAGTDTDSFRVTIKNIHTSSLTVDGNGAETIEGAASVALLENEAAIFALSSGSAEWNIIGFYGPNLVGITATPTELNLMDGVTATTTELNYVDVATAGTAEASKALVVDGSKGIASITSLTSTTINASTSLEIGGVAITSTAAELNYTDGVTSAIQTQLNAKAASGANSDITSLAGLTTDLSIAQGGTAASTASAARTSLGVDAAGTDNSTNVSLAGTPDYITIVGQVLTRNAIDLAADVTGALPAGNIGTNAVETAKINALAVTEAKIGALAVTVGKLAAAAVTRSKLSTTTVSAAGTIATISYVGITLTAYSFFPMIHMTGAAFGGTTGSPGIRVRASQLVPNVTDSVDPDTPSFGFYNGENKVAHSYDVDYRYIQA